MIDVDAIRKRMKEYIIAGDVDSGVEIDYFTLDALIAELEAARAVVHMAHCAYTADAIHSWFDEEDEGLKSALADYDRVTR